MVKVHTISGPQGSGKTTKSRELKKTLEERGNTVMTVYLVRDESVEPHIKTAKSQGFTDLIVERLT